MERKNYKVERLISSSKTWYEVLLSPFDTKEQVMDYYKKYSLFYPKEDSIYKVTNTKNNRYVVLRK